MDDQTEGLWIMSDPLDDGSYAVVLSINGDHSRALGPEEALRYGQVLLQVVAMVDYEEAVYRQLDGAGLPQDVALLVISKMREERPAVDDEATRPLRFVPGLNPAGQGFIRIDLDARPIGQLSASDAREHATAALEAIPNAALDQTYRALLKKAVGLTDKRARQLISDLGTYRSGNQ